MNSNILVITVLYNQALEQTNIYRTLLRECENVFLYDNSPSPETKDNLPAGWHYVSAPSNPGLSKAYNLGAEYASEHGFDWLLITDQDTIFPAGAFQEYTKRIAETEYPEIIIPQVITTDHRFLSPVKTHGYVSRLAESAPSGDINLKKYAVINSGICVNTAAFQQCGGYNEKVSLDFSDFQFIEKFSKINPRAYVLNIKCIQDFSDITDNKEKKLSRFRLFCKSLKGYESSRPFGKVELTGVALKRAISVSLSTKTLLPLRIFLKEYL